MAQDYRQIWRFYVPVRSDQNAEKFEGTVVLDEEESRLAVTVLRLKEGELVELADGAGWIAKGFISAVKKKNVEVFFDSVKYFGKKTFNKFAIVGYPKPGALDEVVQICVDSGIDKLIFFRGEKSTSKQEFKEEKIHKQVMELSRISKAPWLLDVVFCHSLRAAVEICLSARSSQKVSFFVCDERPHHGHEKKSSIHMIDALKHSTGSSWVSVVGPEGSFGAAEYDEMQKIRNNEKLEFVSLGPRILRTPAAVAAATWFMAGMLESDEN